jgi:hypothetical protein
MNSTSPNIHANIIKQLSRLLSASYVIPEIGELICKHLDQKLAEGVFDDLLEGTIFALGVTMEMQDISRDEHLWLKWHPEPLPEGRTSLWENDDWQERKRKQAAEENGGFEEIKKLPGNVGYLNIHSFHKPEWARETVEIAMRSLEGVGALIFDLRKCSGGVPNTVNLVCSYLFGGGEPVHLDSIYWRDEDFTQQVWTIPDLPGPRFIKEPVYVLVSRTTFSGGEAFAYNLQAQGRATIIGDVTDGGAHLSGSTRIGTHFEASIPIGRSINPVTNENWQDIGVIPDIQLPSDRAFTGAYAFALREIINNSENGDPLIVEEAQETLKNLSADGQICNRCGYENAVYTLKCKNCGQALEGLE